MNQKNCIPSMSGVKEGVMSLVSFNHIIRRHKHGNQQKIQINLGVAAVGIGVHDFLRWHVYFYHSRDMWLNDAYNSLATLPHPDAQTVYCWDENSTMRISHDYGEAAPAGGIAFDQWTAVLFKQMSVYQNVPYLITAGADDGMKFHIDSQLLIHQTMEMGKSQDQAIKV